MTNYEHFKGKIIYYAKTNGFTCDIHSMRYGEYTECGGDDCEECARRMLDWLFEEYKAPIIKLSKFEYDLLGTASGVRSTFKFENDKFKDMGILIEMKEKGYYQNIDTEMTIEEILNNCEVAEDE